MHSYTITIALIESHSAFRWGLYKIALKHRVTLLFGT